MLKRNQVRGFAQTRDGNHKTHVGKYPADQSNNNRNSQQVSHKKNVSTSKR